MKKILLLILILSVTFMHSVFSQNNTCGQPVIKPFPVIVSPPKDVIDESDLIFEGRVLSDSGYFQTGHECIYTYHNILVLKQFKGLFKSDTIHVVTYGGRMKVNSEWKAHSNNYAPKGNEAIFCVNVLKWGNQDPNLFIVLIGFNGSYVKVCDKKDVVKEVYEPIEAVTGHPYIEVHPNTCKGQQQKPKK